MPSRRPHCGQQESDRGQPVVSYNTERHPVVVNGQPVVSGQPGVSGQAVVSGQPGVSHNRQRHPVVVSGQPGVSHNRQRHPLAVSGQAVHTGRSVADFDVHHESTVGE